jgi:hypothetical protein
MFPDSSIITAILTTGGTGIAIAFVLIILGFLWPKHAVSEIIAQRDRESARADKAEEERNDAVRIAQDKIVPLLGAFTAATDALLPLLQWQIRVRESHGGRDDSIT